MMIFLLPSVVLPRTADQEDRSPKKSPPVVIDAREKQLISEEVMELKGDVEIAFGQFRFFTDYATFNLKTREVRVPGRVTIYSPDHTIVGDNLTFDISKGAGELTDVHGHIPPALYYRSEVVDQKNPDRIDYRRLFLSSCNQVVPLWSLGSRKGIILKDKYIRMRDVVFRIKKVPVFYLPFIQYPLREGGRSTGFLFPNFGNSTEKGFVVNSQFFWAVRPDLDLTLGFDHFSRVGNGLYAETRWLFRQFEGSVKYYRMLYNLDDDGLNVLQKTSGSDSLVTMEFKKRFEFLKTEVTANVNRQSDPNFLRIFSKGFASQLRTSFSSAVGLKSTVSENIHLTAAVSERQTYVPSLDYISTNRTLPAVNVRVNQQKVGKVPGYFSLDLGYSNTLRTGESVLDSEIVFNKGESKPRIQLNPSYTLEVVNLPFLSTGLKFEGDYSYEFKSLDPDSGEIVDSPILTASNKVLVSVTGPVLYRVFEGRKNRFRHVIQPGITYRFAQVSANIDNALKVSAADYPAFSYMQFSLNTQLVSTRRKDDQTRDILRYSLSQLYYFDPQLAAKNRKVNDRYPEFSELTNKLEFSPLKSWAFDTTLHYNYYLREFTRINFKLKYRYSDHIQGSVFYTKDRNQYTAPDWLFNRSTIGGALVYNPESSPVHLISNINYDLTDGTFRFARILGEIRLQCVKINSEVLIRKNLNGQIIPEFTAGISLGNLGAVQDLLGATF